VDKARFLVEAHLRKGRPVLELAAEHGRALQLDLPPPGPLPRGG
jgi:hypothetical protein